MLIDYGSPTISIAVSPRHQRRCTVGWGTLFAVFGLFLFRIDTIPDVGAFGSVLHSSSPSLSVSVSGVPACVLLRERQAVTLPSFLAAFVSRPRTGCLLECGVTTLLLSAARYRRAVSEEQASSKHRGPSFADECRGAERIRPRLAPTFSGR